MYYIEQNNKFKITPLTVDTTAIKFYDFENYQANVPDTIQEANVSTLFLLNGAEGLSLVVLHDSTESGTGGRADFTFSGLPDEGSWIVRDDDPSNDKYQETTIKWKWNAGKTDGGVFHGGLEDGFEIQIRPSFEEGISEWRVLSGNIRNPTSRTIDQSQPITIKGGDFTLPLRNKEVDVGVGTKASGKLFNYIESLSWRGNELAENLFAMFPTNSGYYQIDEIISARTTNIGEVSGIELIQAASPEESKTPQIEVRTEIRLPSDSQVLVLILELYNPQDHPVDIGSNNNEPNGIQIGSSRLVSPNKPSKFSVDNRVVKRFDNVDQGDSYDLSEDFATVTAFDPDRAVTTGLSVPDSRTGPLAAIPLTTVADRISIFANSTTIPSSERVFWRMGIAGHAGGTDAPRRGRNLLQNKLRSVVENK